MNGHLVTLAQRARGEHAAFTPVPAAFFPIVPAPTEVDDTTADTIGGRRQIPGRTQESDSGRGPGVNVGRIGIGAETRRARPTERPRLGVAGHGLSTSREANAPARPLPDRIASTRSPVTDLRSAVLRPGIPAHGTPAGEDVRRGISADRAALTDEAIDDDSPASTPPAEDDEAGISTSSRRAVSSETAPGSGGREGRRMDVPGERRIPVRATAAPLEVPSVHFRSRDRARDLDTPSPAPAGEEPVRITIGRIEVRAGVPAPPAPPEPGPPRLSLEEYLRQRSRASER